MEIILNLNYNEKAADLRKWRKGKMETNGKALAEKIDFAIFKFRYQIYVILSSEVRTNLRNLRPAFCFLISEHY